MFKRFWLDVFLGTIFILGLMGLFSVVTAFKVFDIMDPIGDAFEDMEFTDIYFSQLLDDPTADEDIVLVNIGYESRGNIAMMVDSISQHNPAAIGMDTFFYFPKEETEDDAFGDFMLMEALGRVENLVMASKMLYNLETDQFDSVATSWPTFTWNSDSAFANLLTDAESQEDLKMCREFNPTLTDDNGKVHKAFAVNLAEYFAPEKTARFLERGNEIEVIKYRGNVLDYGATKFGTKFFALDVPDVFGGNYVPEMIEGKIVIFCYLGQYLGDRESLEDKYFTPLNETYIGRAFPDMYGGVVHANIISMILQEDYVFYLTESQKWIVTLICLFLNIMVFSWIYKKLPRWYDGITKLIQFVQVIGIIYIMIYFLDLYNMKLDLTYLLFAIALSGDGLELFYGVFRNLFSREGRRELFKVSRL